jgi:hypothetical protein
MVDLGSEQGLSVFATAGIELLFRGLRKRACAVEALAKSQKRRSEPKDAIYGWTLVNNRLPTLRHPLDPFYHIFKTDAIVRILVDNIYPGNRTAFHEIFFAVFQDCSVHPEQIIL